MFKGIKHVQSRQIMLMFCSDVTVLTCLVYYLLFMSLYQIFLYFNFDVHVCIISCFNICSNMIYLLRLCIGFCLIIIYVQVISLFASYFFSKLYLKVILYIYKLFIYNMHNFDNRNYYKLQFINIYEFILQNLYSICYEFKICCWLTYQVKQSRLVKGRANRL